MPLRTIARGCRSVPRTSRWIAVLALLVVGLEIHPTVTAAAEIDLNVYPAGQHSTDPRLGPLKDLNGYFPFTVPETRAAWEQRATQLRMQLQVALGLYPWPEKTPSDPVVHGRVEREDYTVDRVYLQSFPGHYVTGSLYRPKGAMGKRPAVLSPHGHWANGRFYDAGREAVRKQIVAGAERFEVGGRYPIQARCVQLARMGCVVFVYDMVGYADSQQIEHRPGVRAALDTPEKWGYFSVQAELRQQHMMGLQTWNSIRALDFLASLPDVDPARIAVTGASGGGTQTFILCALDARPAVAFPAVMVSTAMQGGCTCENCCHLRVGTGNVEIAALTAPRPLGMVSANDWTREFETKGFPELTKLYELTSRRDQLLLRPLVHFPHNYNYVSRAVMYAWLNQQLKLGLPEPIVEEDYVPLSVEEATVWTAEHPQPQAGPEHERALLEWITTDSETQLAKQQPSSAETLAAYRAFLTPAVEAILHRTWPVPESVTLADGRETPREGLVIVTQRAVYQPTGETVPLAIVRPMQWNEETVLWLTSGGKASLLDREGRIDAAVQSLLERGFAVASIDVLGTGESTADGERWPAARLVDNKIRYAGYTYGYNPALVAQRAHDVMTVVAALRREHPDRPIHLVALGDAVPFAAAARSLAGKAIDRTALESGGFRFTKLRALDDPRFWPGIAKYGDLPGLLSLAAPGQLLLLGEHEIPALAGLAYAPSGAKSIAVRPDTGDAAAKAAAAWIAREKK